MVRLYVSMMAAGLVLSVAAGSARAQQLGTGTSAVHTSLGIRGGMTLDADSFNGGLHVNLDGVGGLPDLRIEPLVEIGYGEESVNLGGFGSDDFSYILGRIGASAKYFFPLNPERTLRVHGATNLSLYYAKLNDCVGDCDDTELGASIGGGLEFGRFGVDAFVGLTDETPDFTVTALLQF